MRVQVRDFTLGWSGFVESGLPAPMVFKSTSAPPSRGNFRGQGPHRRPWDFWLPQGVPLMGMASLLANSPSCSAAQPVWWSNQAQRIIPSISSLSAADLPAAAAIHAAQRLGSLTLPYLGPASIGGIPTKPCSNPLTSSKRCSMPVTGVSLRASPSTYRGPEVQGLHRSPECRRCEVPVQEVRCHDNPWLGCTGWLRHRESQRGGCLGSRVDCN